MSSVWKNLTWNIPFLLFNLIVKEYTVFLLLQKGREFYELICWRQKLAGTDCSGMWTPFLSVASKHKHNSTMYFFLLELSSGKLDMESRMCFNYFPPLNWETVNKPNCVFQFNFCYIEKNICLNIPISFCKYVMMCTERLTVEYFVRNIRLLCNFTALQHTFLQSSNSSVRAEHQLPYTQCREQKCLDPGKF